MLIIITIIIAVVIVVIITPRAPSLYILPTLGPKAHKHDLLWAIWSPRVSPHTPVKEPYHSL